MSPRMEIRHNNLMITASHLAKDKSPVGNNDESNHTPQNGPFSTDRYQSIQVHDVYQYPLPKLNNVIHNHEE